MRSTAFKMVCRFLVASLMLMSFTPAQAAMIGTDQMMASTSEAQLDRAAVLSLMSRSEVASQIQAQGLDPQLARERVAAMTDEEVHALRDQIDSLPAGAMSHGAVIAAGVIVLALLIWWIWS